MGSRILSHATNWWRQYALLPRLMRLCSNSTICLPPAIQHHLWAARVAAMIGPPLCDFSVVRGYSIMRPLALLLLLLAVYATPGLSQECSFGAAPCSGRHGTGCYDPAYAACHD